MSFIRSKLGATLSLLLLSTACSEKEKSSTEQIRGIALEDASPIFSKGELGSTDFFVGTVWVTPLLAKGTNNEYSIGNVVFESGARSNWHTHPKGQVLIVTEGVGFHQIKGKEVEILKKGDVINVPENTEHWHGASASKSLTHIAITHFIGDQQVNWLEPVTKEDYENANN
jgi:quercetin dioxygenase-like cupin family protein